MLDTDYGIPSFSAPVRPADLRHVRIRATRVVVWGEGDSVSRESRGEAEAVLPTCGESDVDVADMVAQAVETGLVFKDEVSGGWRLDDMTIDGEGLLEGVCIRGRTGMEGKDVFYEIDVV